MKTATLGRTYQHVQRKLTEQERTALRESLASHGLLDEITLDQNNDILDGYNREDLCRELGIETRYRTLEVDDPIYWIRHHQTARRNLGEKEMRELIKQTKAQYPEASTRTIGEKLGVDHSTVVRTLQKSGGADAPPVKGKDGKTYKPKAKTSGDLKQPKEKKPKSFRIGWATAVIDKIGKAGPHWQTINNQKTKAEKLLGHAIPGTFSDPDAARRFVEDYESIVMPVLFPNAAVAEPVTVEDLVPTKQQAFEAALRTHKRKLELEFDQRVAEAAHSYLDDTLLPRLKEREADADRIIKHRKGSMTRAQYRKVLSCLHPDVITDPGLKPRFEEAFRIFQPLELVLCSEKELPTKPSDLPKTLAELLARKKTKR